MPLAFEDSSQRPSSSGMKWRAGASRSRVRNALERSICRSRSKSVRGRKSGVAVDVERARKGAQKAADDAKNGPMKIVLIGPFGRGNHRLSGVDFKRFRMSS